MGYPKVKLTPKMKKNIPYLMGQEINFEDVLGKFPKSSKGDFQDSLSVMVNNYMYYDVRSGEAFFYEDVSDEIPYVVLSKARDTIYFILKATYFVSVNDVDGIVELLRREGMLAPRIEDELDENGISNEVLGYIRSCVINVCSGFSNYGCWNYNPAKNILDGGV